MRGSSLLKLGLSPGPTEVEHWFQEAAAEFVRFPIGQSTRGREIAAFRWSSSGQPSPTKVRRLTVLYISLVHGNEPLGLAALLHTADLVQKRAHQLARRYHRDIELIFVPIVNPDAYTLNIEFGKGCRRTNLNRTCPKVEHANDDQDEFMSACPRIPPDGVDLNRNYPVDWEGDESRPGTKCIHNYHGTHPFSEKETQAIRDLVIKVQPQAAMSFHSRAQDAQHLLLHPFTSTRAQEQMDKVDAQRFREWSSAMNRHNDYKTGNALEGIGYTAGGSTIDWLYSQNNVTAFVLEAGTPCGERWCHLKYQRTVNSNSRRHAQTALMLTELVLQQAQGPPPSHYGSAFLGVVGMLLLILLFRKYKLALLRPFRDDNGKRSKSEVEMRTLV